MTSQRTVLSLMAAVVAGLLAIVATVVLTGGSGAGPAAPSADPFVPGTVAPTTSTTTPATLPAPTLAPTTTAAPMPAVDLPVTAAGSVFAPPPVPDVRTEDFPNDCQSLVDQGWQSLDCQTARTPGGDLTYLIEVLPSPTFVATHAYVLRRTASGAEQVVLQALDDTGNRFDTSEVEAAVAPVGAGASPAIVMGFPRINGSLTTVEVIAWPGVVTVHEDLNGGVVQSAPGQLDTWARTPDGLYVHDRIKEDGSRWHIVGQATVGAAEVPRLSILA